MKYEVILFDADETLYDLKKSEREALKNTMLDFKIEYVESFHLQAYEEINKFLWKELEKGLITQEKLNIERFKRLSNQLNLNIDATKFAKSYIEHLADASFLYDDSTDLIENLYKYYKLSIVTNGLTFVQDKRIRKSTISKYFDDIVISEEILISKPDPRIFELALKNIKHTDKSKVIIVGDSLTSDIQCGINFGIDVC